MTTPRTPIEALNLSIERTQEVQAAARLASVELTAEEAGEEEPEEQPQIEISERPSLGG